MGRVLLVETSSCYKSLLSYLFCIIIGFHFGYMFAGTKIINNYCNNNNNNNNNNIASSILFQHLQLDEQQQQQQRQHRKDEEEKQNIVSSSTPVDCDTTTTSTKTNTDSTILQSSDVVPLLPLFPKSISKLFYSAATIPRDDFINTIDTGFPIDPTTSIGNEDVLILYPSKESMPSTNNNQTNNNNNNNNNSKKSSKSILHTYTSTSNALENCAEMKLILTQPNNNKDVCTVIMGQWENYHVHRYMRLNNDDKNKEDYEYYLPPNKDALNLNNPLRFVSRLHTRNGGRLGYPSYTLEESYRYLLIDYLQKLPKTLQRLKPIINNVVNNINNNNNDNNSNNSNVNSITKKPIIIVMVCNYGQAELFINFVCTAKARDLDLSRILLFATDNEMVKLANEFNIAVFEVNDAFGVMPKEAAQQFSDTTFGSMMMSKVYSAHLINTLEYDFIFQDVDIVWYKDPIQFFENFTTFGVNDDFDIYYQDDGSRSASQHSYSANTGFYYVKYNLRTRAFFSSIIRFGDLILLSNIDQPTINMLLNDYVSIRGLRIKIFGKDSKLGKYFPTGHTYHMNKNYMKEFLINNNNNNNKYNYPYIFHMNWTQNKTDKIKFFQQMGDWYVSDTCNNNNNNKNNLGPNCCLQEPHIQCHFKDKPSKVPCPDSPLFQQGGRSFW